LLKESNLKLPRNPRDCDFIHKGLRVQRTVSRNVRAKGRRGLWNGARAASCFLLRMLSPSARAAIAEKLGADRARRDVRLAPYTTFRIGGPADVFFEAQTADDLARAVTVARELGVEYFVLGLGANILVGDRGFRGLVIRNAASHHQFDADGRLWTESGAVMKDLIQEAVRLGWSGLEHYVGIPSTVGGAIWQNLHFLSPAPERERTMFIAEVFESCEILSDAGRRLTVDADYVRFGYDDSVFHHTGDVILAAKFRLTKADPVALQRILQENLSWRGSRHPWLDWHPSAGSIFKKIEGVGAGRLVDQCGLKGHRIGDAQISHIHANIMVNLGSATAADVRSLISTAQSAVRDKFGLELEPEIGFIGEF
jgi:UDP-N-acetylmuramate dehydrogenase